VPFPIIRHCFDPFGRIVKRADIWAFGCVLYEMLTGKRGFEGEDVSVTLSQVLQREPDWAALPKGTPSSLCRLLRRALQKNPSSHRRCPAGARRSGLASQRGVSGPTTHSTVAKMASMGHCRCHHRDRRGGVTVDAPTAYCPVAASADAARLAVWTSPCRGH
jgi:hypothetical protein